MTSVPLMDVTEEMKVLYTREELQLIAYNNSVRWHFSAIYQSRDNIKLFSRLLAKMPNSRDLLRELIQHEQGELKYYMDELVKVKRGYNAKKRISKEKT